MHLIEYATEADGPELAKINVQSFQDRRLLGEVFPEASVARLQEYKAIVGMKHLANPNMHVLKIQDPASGELVTYSRWHLPASFGESLVTLSDQAATFAKDPLSYAPQPMNEGVLKAFKTLLEDSRKRYTTENDMSKWPRLRILERGVLVHSSFILLLKSITSPRSTSDPAWIPGSRLWLCYS